MNIYKILHRFWNMRQRMRVSSPAADMFYALVQHANYTKWQNPFQLDNGILCAITGMSLSSMKKARTQLHETGMIGYLPGQQKKANPWYKLYQDDKDYMDDPRWRGGHFVAIDAATKMHFLWPSLEDSKTNILVSTETIERERIEGGEKILDGRGSPAASGQRSAPEEEKSCAQKEEDSEYHKVPYWRALRSEVWFEFYRKNFGRRPRFKGRDFKSFREILLHLEKQHTESGISWTEDVAKKTLWEFLESAYQDEKFLRPKFLLINLLTQYDAIIANQHTGAFTRMQAGDGAAPAKGAKPGRGRGASVEEILSADY